MPKSLSFHIEPSANPAKILVVLRVLADNAGTIERATQLDELALDYRDPQDEAQFDRARSLASQLGFIVQDKMGVRLSETAEIILRKRPAVQGDLLHSVFYNAWQLTTPEEHTRAWFYRTTCDYLWELGETSLDLTFRNGLTLFLTNAAHEAFAEVAAFQPNSLSVGMKSVQGVVAWLERLQPAVITANGFHRRAACSPELVALSLAALSSGIESGTDILLSPERRKALCHLCLLDPTAFDRMLDWTLETYPRLITAGTRSGAYGRFIRLLQPLTFKELD